MLSKRTRVTVSSSCSVSQFMQTSKVELFCSTEVLADTSSKTKDEVTKRMNRLQKAYILDNNGEFDSRFFSSKAVRLR